MSTIKVYNPETKLWEVSGTADANSVSVDDLKGNYESSNVEGCLMEVMDLSLEQQTSIDSLNETMADHLENHPSGGGGGGEYVSPCKITSSFKDGYIDGAKDVIIPIFFSSTNRGNGTCYIAIDGIEVASQSIKQGTANINVGKLLNKTTYVSIYVKDNKGIMSNNLEWDFINASIQLKIKFNFEIDYDINSKIDIPYEVITEIEEDLTLILEIDGTTYEHPIKKGYGSKLLTQSDIGVGVYNAKVSVKCKEFDFSSDVQSVTLAVISSRVLNLSSTFKKTEMFYGEVLQVEYRISKLSSEFFTVNKKIDGEVVQNDKLQVGIHYFTYGGLAVGHHIIEIEVFSIDGEKGYLKFEIDVIMGDYTPVEVTTDNLLCWFDATDMTNTLEDKEHWIDRSGNNTVATLHEFNFSSNGWIEKGEEGASIKEKVLSCNTGGYVEIDLSPFKTNAKSGLTIEILYKAYNIGDERARVFDCTDIIGKINGENVYIGAYVDTVNAIFNSDKNSAKVTIDEDTEVRITFVIDRYEKFCKVYIDAVLCRTFKLSDVFSGANQGYENFEHPNKILLNKGNEGDSTGSCDIKVLRVYDTQLTSEQVLLNHIADITDLAKQKEKYNFNFNNHDIPKMVFTGPKDAFKAMTQDNAVTIAVSYSSPNPDFYGESFNCEKSQVMWQGTSSIGYIIKNYTIYLRDNSNKDVYYTPFKDGFPENIFCMKADYVESSHANNVGMAKFINDNAYEEKTPVQVINENYRTTVDGFPVLLYQRFTGEDDIGEILVGVYNFNLDRYSTLPFGYKETDNKDNDINCLVYEVAANSEDTAGAFKSWTPDTGKDIKTYFSNSFKLIYPPSRKGNDNLAEVMALVDWVDSASDKEFEDNISEHFNLHYLLRYYLLVMIIGAVDSLGFWLN